MERHYRGHPRAELVSVEDVDADDMSAVVTASVGCADGTARG
jgi:hypothetical protein